MRKKLANKKILICTTIVLLVIQSAAAQKMGFFSGGVSLLTGWDKNSSNATILPSFTVAPGIKFVQKGDFTVLVHIPISFGISFQNDDESKLLTYAGFDAPVICNFLFGPGFGNQSKAKTGFMVGAGVGYHVSENEIYWNGITTHHLRFTGMIFNAGPTFRFPKTGPDDKEGGLFLRFSWLGRYTDLKKNVVGIGLIFF